MNTFLVNFQSELNHCISIIPAKLPPKLFAWVISLQKTKYFETRREDERDPCHHETCFILSPISSVRIFFGWCRWSANKAIASKAIGILVIISILVHKHKQRRPPAASRSLRRCVQKGTYTLLCEKIRANARGVANAMAAGGRRRVCVNAWKLQITNSIYRSTTKTTAEADSTSRHSTTILTKMRRKMIFQLSAGIKWVSTMDWSAIASSMSHGHTYFCVSFFFSASSKSASLKLSTTDATRFCAVSAWPVQFNSQCTTYRRAAEPQVNIFQRTNHIIPSSKQFPRKYAFVFFWWHLRHPRIVCHSEISTNNNRNGNGTRTKESII